MINKVIFVGIHHKLGLPSLCSSTMTGKVIDRIAMKVSLDCEKTNLYPTSYRPDSLEGEQFVDEFANNIDDDALYVGLGIVVCQHLDRMNIPHLITVHHPGYPIRIGKVDEYIQDVVAKINDKVFPELITQ